MYLLVGFIRVYLVNLLLCQVRVTVDDSVLIVVFV